MILKLTKHHLINFFCLTKINKWILHFFNTQIKIMFKTKIRYTLKIKRKKWKKLEKICFPQFTDF